MTTDKHRPLTLAVEDDDMHADLLRGIFNAAIVTVILAVVVWGGWQIVAATVRG